MDQTLAEVWRPILGGGPGVSWVVFETGTCVVLENPEGDLVAQAIEVLKRWGPVHAGSSFGDFRVVDLENGWIVTSHHKAIATWVFPAEVTPGLKTGQIGMLGRSKRGKDTKELHVVHVEDNR